MKSVIARKWIATGCHAPITFYVNAQCIMKNSSRSKPMKQHVAFNWSRIMSPHYLCIVKRALSCKHLELCKRECCSMICTEYESLDNKEV